MTSAIPYDKDSASRLLERAALHRLNCAHTTNHILTVTQEEDWTVTQQPMTYGPITRLASPNSDDTYEETIVCFQGIIEQLDLPPFKEKPSGDKPNQAKFLRQSVSLTGLNTKTFGAITERIAEVHALFSRAVGRDEEEECGMFSQEGDKTILHMSNRYFTPRKDVGSLLVVPLTPDIDPLGYLARIAGQNYVHTEDNVVRYYEKRRKPGSDEYSFVPCNPIMFRVGDIVEVQVSFIMLTLREGKKRTAMVLRTLSLLDGTATQRSKVKQLTQTKGVMKADASLKRKVGYGEEEASRNQSTSEANERPVLKRRVGYGQEEVSRTGSKLSEMVIDGPSNVEGTISETAKTLD